MLNKNKIISVLREQNGYLKKKYHLSKVGLFGSFAKDEMTEESDIDLLVEFDKPIGLDFIELGDYLEELFKRKVDMVTREGLKNSRLKLEMDKVLYVG